MAATFKDKATNVCALVTTICGSVAAYGVIIGMSKPVLAVFGLIAAVSIAVSQFLTGKGPDGKPIKPSE